MSRNLGYYLSEVKAIFRLNRFSSILSLISLGMIFLVLQLAVTGWWVSTAWVTNLKDEAEINVYYSQDIAPEALEALAVSVGATEGVREVSPVSAEEAYDRMAEILGKDAAVLGQFDVNPFQGFLEVRIRLDHLRDLPAALASIPGVEYVRDNREILEKLSRLADAVLLLGSVIAAAVTSATVIITSHIIREGVHSHREQIDTLKLLGAPDRFIHAPFLMGGTLMTVMAGVLSSLVYGALVTPGTRFVEETLPFLPVVDMAGIFRGTVGGLLLLSLLLGAAGSRFGLLQVRRRG